MGEPNAIELRFLQDRQLLAEAMYAAGRSLKISTGRPYLDIAICIAAGVIISVGCILLVKLVAGLLGYRFSRSLILIAVGLMLVVIVVYMRLMARRNTKKLLGSKIYDGPIQVRISADGVVVSSALIESVVRWGGIDDVIRMRTGIGLRMGGSVFPVPFEAIPAELGLQGCLDRIEAWRKAAQ